MELTTPNKEVVRRICHLHKATKCHLYLNTKDNIAEVLANISDENVSSCKVELESWAGMKFKVFNYNTNKDIINNFLRNGAEILPIKL